MRIMLTVWIAVASGAVLAALGASNSSIAHALNDRPMIRVSIAIPQLCNVSDGKPAIPRFLPRRYDTERFPVVIENVSDKPEQVWAAGNSIGDYTLSFEITDADGKTIVVRQVQREYSKNIFRTERLLPGETTVRDVSYNATPPIWYGFPSPDRPTKVTIRAILTQTTVPDSKNPELWVGKTKSAPQEVMLGQ